MIALTKPGWAEATVVVGAEDPRLDYAGYVHQNFVAAPDGSQIVRFDRELDMTGSGFRWDNPGATIRFRTDATEIVAVFDYNELHNTKVGRNSKGVYSVDGVFRPEWSFQPKQTTVQRMPEVVLAPITNGGVAGFHDYALYLPYADSVDFGGLRVNEGAAFEPVKAKPAVRYVAFGDSITHGFTASEMSKTYPFLLAKAKGWQMINLGFGGRSILPDDAKVISALKPDVVTVLMGVNNWQGGTPLKTYRERLEAFVTTLRVDLPTTPIYFLTFLWVNPTWKPTAAIADLEAYRQVVRDVVAAQNDANLAVIEGPGLIDAAPGLFDPVPVHPNDKGFAMMAERLGQQMKDVEARPPN